ncbi:MAG: zinc ABC transporter permease AztB [Candidatus Limnocylindrales bacterium]
MEYLLDPFLNNAFMTRALLAGVVVSIACAVVGTFVVLRGLAFIGDALAHGVLPGIAAAILLGLPGMLGAAVGALVMIGGVSLVQRRSRLSSDTAIGLLFVAMLALGVVIISASDAFQGDLVAILFGQILGTSWEQIAIMVGATALVIGVSAVAARPFMLLSFDPEQADVAGYPSRRFHMLMLLLVALTVVVAFQTVGTLLVFGMLLAPAAAGALMARRIGTMMAIAAVIGSVSTYLGLLISYWFDYAAGATIVLVAVSIFFVVFAVTNVRDASRHLSTTDASGETLS